MVSIIHNNQILSFDDLSKFINGKGMSILDFLIKIVLAIVLYVIAHKLLKYIIGRIQKRLDKHGVDPIASHFVLSLIKYLILVFLVFTIITQLNIVAVTSIAALIASAGVGISLAMQGALSNFAGGVLLLMIKPFKKGDYIVIPNANVEGVVEIIEIYYTTIHTIYGETIKIPNSQLTNNSVINKSSNDMRVLVINVNVSYDSDIDKIREVIQGILDGENRIEHGNTQIFVDELSESGVKIAALMTLKVTDYLSVKRDINERILKEFRKNNIEIPYNQLDIHIRDKSA